MSTVTPPSPGSKKGRLLGRGTSKEFRSLVKQIEANGGQVRPPRGKGHPAVYYDGEFVTTICFTPSDSRSRKNELAGLRRAGMDIKKL